LITILRCIAHGKVPTRTLIADGRAPEDGGRYPFVVRARSADSCCEGRGGRPCWRICNILRLCCSTRVSEIPKGTRITSSQTSYSSNDHSQKQMSFHAGEPNTRHRRSRAAEAPCRTGARGQTLSVIPFIAFPLRAPTPDISLFKSSGCRPSRHIHNPHKLMFFARRSGQRIDTGFIVYRKVRPCSQLHRSDTEASQIAEVRFSDLILQDEGRVRDGEHIVRADSTLHFPTFLPPSRIFAESFQDTSGRALHK
jgi:hypothetical protein